MKFLSRALFLVFLLIGVLLAVSNTQPVQIALWPLPHSIVLPLFLLVVALLLLGVLAGLALGWWAARRHRRRSRERHGEVTRLEREIASLRAALAAAKPPTAGPADPAPRELRAIERQSALVAPEPFKQ